MKRSVLIDTLPQRIVSLVPSQTELLFDLGLGDRIVGVTKFCTHPKEKTKAIPKVGGTKNFNLAEIEPLQPDLIIGNKEENYLEGIDALARHYPVWVSDINTLPEALEMMAALGEITGTQARSTELITQTQDQFSSLLPSKAGITAAYFIWRSPYMAVGHQTFIDDMLTRCGFENAFGNMPRYPEIAVGQLQEKSPQVILLSSEPYPFKEKHVAEFAEICPNAIIRIVDGELFSWYGSRLLHSAPYFKKIIEEVATIRN